MNGSTIEASSVAVILQEIDTLVLGTSLGESNFELVGQLLLFVFIHTPKCQNYLTVLLGHHQHRQAPIAQTDKNDQKTVQFQTHNIAVSSVNRRHPCECNELL